MRGVDPDILERLLTEHGAALELFAAQWTDVPEDCVQEGFLELARQETGPERVVAWLYRVVRNRAISAARAAMRRKRHETAAATFGPSMFAPARHELIDDRALTQALQSVGDEQREVIVARIWGGLTFEQIGEVVGISTSSAHRRYEAGLKILRERLGLSWLNEKRSSTV